MRALWLCEWSCAKCERALARTAGSPTPLCECDEPEATETHHGCTHPIEQKVAAFESPLLRESAIQLKPNGNGTFTVDPTPTLVSISVDLKGSTLRDFRPVEPPSAKQIRRDMQELWRSAQTAPTMPARGAKDWIQVFTGGKVFPLDPRVEDIDIRDIARALSMQCRYAGHVARFYSVAEHSVRVSRLVHERTGDAALSLWGLLHDASEAYLTDIPRPLKHQPEMAKYREAEKRMQAVIAERFNLPTEEPEVVKAIDWEILGTEAVQLKSPIHPDWGKTTSTGSLPAPLPLGELGWNPDVAEACFLSRFHALVEQCAEVASGGVVMAQLTAEVRP